MRDLRWVDEKDGSTLYFTPYYDEIEIAHIGMDLDSDYWYSSSTTRDDNELLDAANWKDAKRVAEEIIQHYYDGERDNYSYLSQKFEACCKEKES